MYKIGHKKKSGMFQRKGLGPTWNKWGNVWSQKGHIKNHLKQLVRHPTVGSRWEKKQIDNLREFKEEIKDWAIFEFNENNPDCSVSDVLYFYPEMFNEK